MCQNIQSLIKTLRYETIALNQILKGASHGICPYKVRSLGICTVFN